MNMRAISPVIATVIIVSVAIAIAVAVAFWMTGITGLFTRYEKLEIVSAYATSSDGGWTITIIVRNTGTTDTTVDQVFINGIPSNQVDGISSFTVDGVSDTTFSPPNNPLSLRTGETATIQFTLNSDGFKPGQIVEVKLHTAAGNEYPKSVQLP